MVAEGEPLLAVAAEELQAATKRRERIERGENVSLPGKPPSLKDVRPTPPALESPAASSPRNSHRVGAACVKVGAASLGRMP
jgi:hypothetical protein